MLSLSSLIGLFFLSGITGLIYQVTWVRGFGRVFGNTLHSASIVTAVFMLGLGIGGYVVGRWIDRKANPHLPLRVYAYFEIFIGVWAAIVWMLIEYAEPLSALISSYTRDAQGWHYLTTGSYVARYVIATLALTPITLAMGGTLTVLARYIIVASLPQAGYRIGLLYGFNTAGAALGAYLTDGTLIPAAGLTGTQAVAVSINFLVALIALRAARLSSGVGVPPSVTAESARATFSSTAERFDAKSFGLALTLVLSGIAGLGFEMVWFRHLSLQLGAFRAVYSVLLTVVLLGIWAGAVAGGVFHRWFNRPGELLMLSFGGFGFTAVVSFAYLRARVSGHGDSGMWDEFVAIAASAALPSFFMGFAYPLGNACIQTVHGAIGSRAGLLYLANTLGAVIGSLMVGFALISWFGTQHTVTALLGVLVLATLVAYASASARRVALAVSLAMSTMGLMAWIRLPADFLMREGVPPRVKDHRLLALSESLYELIAITEAPEGYRRLNTNGHAMSDTHLMNQRYMRAFAHIPLLQIRDPKRALVICFGVGSTAHAASLHPLEHLEIVDISRHVLAHGSYFSANHHDVLRQPIVRVYVNDGRLHLRMMPRHHYDLITMEPPPINTVGVASLYSSDFYTLVKSRLRERGYIAQWLPGYQVSPSVNRSIVRAFLDIFPGAVLLSGKGNELILLGQKSGSTTIRMAEIKTALRARPAVQVDLDRVHLGTLTEIAGMFVADAATLEEATAGVPPLTDDYPISEYDRDEPEIPAAFVNVTTVSRWCRDCFEGGRPSTHVARLDEYLRITGSYYASTKFRFRRPAALDIPMPERISVEVVERSSYLQTQFRFDRATLVSTSTAF